jgi:hypothetical protein
MTESTSPRPLRTIPVARVFVWLAALALPLGIAAEWYARFDDQRQFGTPFSANPDLNRDLILQDSLGVRGRPSGQYMGWRLNSGGFRSPEAALTAKPDCPLVMTLGSSETFGYMESPGKEYPAQLADSLAGRGCFRVLNAGIVGMNLPGTMQYFALWGARFHPDVVVLIANPLPYLGDGVPAAPARTPGNGSTAPSRFPWRPRLPSKLKALINYPAFIQRRRIERMVERLIDGKPDDWFFREIPNDRLAMFRRDLIAAVETIRATGATPLLVMHPMRYTNLDAPGARTEMQAMRQFGARPLPEVLLAFDRAGGRVAAEIATTMDVPVVDLPAVMNGHLELFSDPVHYSEAGAAVIAAQLSRAISSLPTRHAGADSTAR